MGGAGTPCPSHYLGSWWDAGADAEVGNEGCARSGFKEAAAAGTGKGEKPPPPPRLTGSHPKNNDLNQAALSTWYVPGPAPGPLTSAVSTRKYCPISQMGKLRPRGVEDAAKVPQPMVAGRGLSAGRLSLAGALGEKGGLAFPLPPFWGILGEAVCMGLSCSGGKRQDPLRFLGSPRLQRPAHPSLGISAPSWLPPPLCAPRPTYPFSSCKHLSLGSACPRLSGSEPRVRERRGASFPAPSSPAPQPKTSGRDALLPQSWGLWA